MVSAPVTIVVRMPPHPGRTEDVRANRAAVAEPVEGEALADLSPRLDVTKLGSRG